VNFLLDTHALLWLAFEQRSIPHHVRQIVASPQNEIIVSAATAWEITTKYRLGKLEFARGLAMNFVPRVLAAGYQLLPITPEHALRAGLLPGTHKDPFDRILSAQAIHEDLILLSNDADLDQFAVRREW
jgi:PIN domain nuclease of toxin-antitoxin system